jgi:hypothetical protein
MDPGKMSYHYGMKKQRDQAECGFNYGSSKSEITARNCNGST